ncbi:MAG TPA: peptide chain release factor N(5)-glutamine methyltransferase [Burkholderiales bacterium]|nr:peptide chain release factor N(5)-glutamine methyltransferase [Burkholderiales bacterium]
MSVRIHDMLKAGGVEPQDARVLLRNVLQTSDAQLAAHPEHELTEDQRRRYLALVQRRRKGEPIAYLTGEREFYSLPFRVTPEVLIPRPETELLVDLAMERAPRGRTCRVLDLATGSGCVAITIAFHCTQAQVTAADVSAAALALTRENAVRNGVALELLESDWFDKLSGRRFDVIVANPPYVAANDRHLAEGDVRFEPRHALVAGRTGYECIETIVARSPRHLGAGGWLMFEHGFDQAQRSRELLVRAGFRDVFSTRDLAGLERASGGRV